MWGRGPQGVAAECRHGRTCCAARAARPAPGPPRSLPTAPCRAALLSLLVHSALQKLASQNQVIAELKAQLQAAQAGGGAQEQQQLPRTNGSAAAAAAQDAAAAMHAEAQQLASLLPKPQVGKGQ